RLGDLFPGCPAAERDAIAAHACKKYSGRIGRTAAAQQFDPDVIELAVRARIRHCCTDYDTLLARGVERTDARTAVRDALNKVCERWRQRGG
ncbi:MAG TPA: DUF2293 domain-containing protein, partial [Steroidobacteraceae bacterium]